MTLRCKHICHLYSHENMIGELRCSRRRYHEGKCFANIVDKDNIKILTLEWEGSDAKDKEEQRT